MSIRRSTGILFLIKLIKLPLVVFTLVLTARYFGVSIDRDIWLVGFAVVSTLGGLLWVPLNEVLRAKFVQIKESLGEHVVVDQTKSLIVYVAIVSILVSLVVFLYPNVLIEYFVPSYSADRLESLIYMVRVLIPYLILNQLNSLFTSILNAYDIFYLPEIASVVSQVSNIIFIIYLSPYLGIYSLAIALYVSNIFLLLLLIHNIIKLNLQLFKFDCIPKFDGFRTYFLYSIPFFLPNIISQLGNMVLNTTATKLGLGIISIVDISRKIPEQLNSVLLSIIWTIMIPVLTKAYTHRNHEEYEKSFLQSYQLGIFVLACFIIFYFIGADALSILLYNSENIKNTEMQKIVTSSKLFAFSLIGVYSYIIFGGAMLSSNKSKIYALCAVIAQISLIVYMITLVKWLNYLVYPLAILFSHLFAAFIMLYYYPYRKNVILRVTIKYYFFILINVLFCSWIYGNFDFGNYYNFNNAVISLVFSLLLALTSILLSSLLIKIDEVKIVLKFLRSRF